MYQCNLCGKEFEKSRSFAGHLSSHSRFESYKVGRAKERPILEVQDKTCNYCNQTFENGWQLGGHKINCKLNPDRDSIILNRSKRSAKYDILTQQNHTLTKKYHWCPSQIK